MKRTIYLILAAHLIGGSAAWAIPNEITYQGTLKSKGLPANSPPLFDMQFQLTDKLGTIPYSLIITSQVSVVNGLFSVPLSFQLQGNNTWDSIDPYLKVLVNGQELRPTEHVAATAYAFVSNSVVNGAITLPKLDSFVQGSLVPTGSVIAYAGQSVPNGWLLCDGSAVSRTQYSTLFTAIGTNWGSGDNSSTFNLPDLRGRAPIGAGQGPSLSNRSLGQILGEEKHALTTNEMPSHSHGVSPGTATVGTGVATIDGAHPGNFLPGGNAQALGIQSTGGGQPHDIMQPSAVVNYIIKS